MAYMVSETQEQTALFSRARLMEAQMPELALMYHIPNEGKRSKINGAVLKAMGLRPGMPDVCLPVPRGVYTSLYIEMKTEKGTVSKDQKKRMQMLESAGCKCVVCRGFEAAKDEIVKYLEQPYKYELKVVHEPYKGWRCEQYGDFIELPGASERDLTAPKELLLVQAFSVAKELVKNNIEYVVKEDTVGWKMPFMVKKEDEP